MMNLNMSAMLRRCLGSALAGTCMTGMITAANADPLSSQIASPEQLERLQNLRINTTPLRAVEERAAPVPEQEARVQIIVRLSGAPVGALPQSFSASRSDHKYTLEYAQDDLVARLLKKDDSIRVMGRVQHVLNAVFLEVPAEMVDTIARDAAVIRVAPVGRYELQLDDTVPYVGAKALQDIGLDGSGVKVAVLDSGIDYLHADLGGAGDPEDYNGNDPNIIEEGTFPTARVVAGYDFVGSQWPAGPLLPDPDPLDDSAELPGSGHGTHVADIIGGAKGVAPGVDLVAVKVCSSNSSSCSGIALIQGMDFAVDPNGDGDTSDRVDIINMSLGSRNGQPFDDDLSQAVENASKLGVLTVASAGNCGDENYCTGSPAAAPSALSVAQTQVPSATGYLMAVTAPETAAGLYEAVRYAWTPDVTGLVSGPVQYGDLDGTNLNGCDPFTGDLTGMIVAVDRGACAFSQKIRNIENAGGVLGIVMLIAPGAPFAGSFAGGDPINIPGFNIGQADGNILRAGDAEIEFSPDLTFSLAGSTVSSTARGPDVSFNNLKPEIGAPGASISALAGSGVGVEPFGGTSGAAPMVAGAAALLQQQCKAADLEEFGTATPGCAPFELKTLLVNRAYRDVISDTTDMVAEITRIGGGELRVDKSAAASFMAYAADQQQPTIALGFHDLIDTKRILFEVRVDNLSDRLQILRVQPTFRFQDDEDSGVVNVRAPRRIFVPAGGSKNFKLEFEIDPLQLSGNPMNSGPDGNNPAALSAAEFDGYLILTSREGEEAALPWHIIPRKAAAVETVDYSIDGEGGISTVALWNDGSGDAQFEAFSIIGLSDDKPRGAPGQQNPSPDLKAVGVSTLIVPTTTCSAGFVWRFAFNTWERQSHLIPVQHRVQIDMDNDGDFDYEVFNSDLAFVGDDPGIDDGRQVAWVVENETGLQGAFFFAEHATNTGNTILQVCGEQLGMTADDLGVKVVTANITTFDFYFGGESDPLPEPVVMVPGVERFLPTAAIDDLGSQSFATFELFDFGPEEDLSPQYGLMLISNSDRGAGARGGATQDTESLLLLLDGTTPPAPLP